MDKKYENIISLCVMTDTTLNCIFDDCIFFEKCYPKKEEDKKCPKR
jgi:hypothetical protein